MVRGKGTLGGASPEKGQGPGQGGHPPDQQRLIIFGGHGQDPGQGRDPVSSVQCTVWDPPDQERLELKVLGRAAAGAEGTREM